MRRWTPRQAGYQLTATIRSSTRPDTPECPGMPVHFVPTRHGVVARTWVGCDLVEITLRRPRNQGATFQGTVRAERGGWVAYDPDQNQISTVHGDYLDAEANLLPLRTRRRSSVKLHWPRLLLPAA